MSGSAPRPELRRGWDVYEIGLRDDPHAALRELRESDPLHDAGNGVFLVTRHADVLRVLRDPRLRAGSGVSESFGASSGLLHDVMQSWLMALDGPEHARARGLVSREFTPRRVAALEPVVAGIAERLVGALANEADGAAGADLVGGLALALPCEVIRHLFRVGGEEWSERVVPLFRPGARGPGGGAVLEELAEYFQEKIARPERLPPDGLLALLRVADPEVGSLAERRACEFVRDLASPLPLRVIAHRLGLPAEDVPRLKRWSDAWVEPLGYACSKEREIEIAWLGVELQRYLASKFAEKRRAPEQDILSDLVQGRLPDGRPLCEAEAMGLAEHIAVGGHETVTSALAAGLLLLMQHPEVARELRADPGLVRNFVEEALRLESPSQGFFRYALRDSELHGVAILKGSMVHLRFAAANRDPEQFPDPDRLDLRRPNPGAHLAFGQGMHHCLGAPLARLELVLAFRTILQRFESLRLAPGHGPPRHLPGLSLRSLRELHVELGGDAV